ncbi:MAG: TspO/MBR family protein [Acidimicrobiia bacterium]|nr:TspO/MBR family protein [Acidimicrobiia bacterium]
MTSVALVVVYAAGSGWWVSTGDDWYQRLEQPAWQPPDAVFGLAWTYNFGALIAAGLAVSLQGTGAARVVWIAGLTLSVAAALAWARLFYVDHALWASAVLLIVATLLTIPLVVAAFITRTWAGAILVPYQVWLGLAASLAVGYARLN